MAIDRPLSDTPAAPPESPTDPLAPQPTRSTTIAPPPDNPEPSGRAGHRRRPWLIAGATLVVVAALVPVLIHVSHEQERAYDKGHAAYLRGDCDAATDSLRRAAQTDGLGDDEDRAVRAQAELHECEELLGAGDLVARGQLAESTTAYADFVTKYPRSPLASIALDRGQLIVGEESPERIATGHVCRDLDRLEAQHFVAKPDETLPPLLHACGKVFESENALDEALAVYDRFRGDYPAHSLRPDVDRAYARAIQMLAEATGARPLNTPVVIGPNTEARDLAAVVIRNASPERLTIVFNGPDVRVEELPPCAECTYSGDGPATCPEQGPEGRYIVEPGTYDVIVKTPSTTSVAPFRGTWPLDKGQTYGDCFLIVTT